ncbi:MAG: calB 3 [Solirubrobacterales bacterium]|nr:calB 3 [Solirubrobacterales bacterium]
MSATESYTAAVRDGHTTGAQDDAAAIAELHEIVERQRAAFLAEPFPTLEERQGLLGALAAMLLGHRVQIEEALSADFGVHPPLAADLIEVLGPAGRAVYAAEQLGGWMAQEPRAADPALYGSGRAFVQPQPKGVVGNIVPWNFPFDLSVGPLVEMLAAGNRVVIKPSEYTPACGELLREMVHATFDRERVDVLVGGLELARAFTHVRWDHLLYTGSPAIGREVAKAAAEQLVPVTLELGGKCPAILSEDSIDAESVKQVLATKAIKNGQMCISVDYCLVPRARLEDFARLAADYVRDAMPGYCTSDSCTGIVSSRHLQRIEGLLEDARARGCDVRALEEAGEANPAARRLPISLVIDAPDDVALMQEEIFGPILPVKAYDTLDQAIDYVNAGERPLALYVFAKDAAVADELLRRTTSGGASVNAAAVHGALPSLPFGGIGQSGAGRHHGIEGFREFSNLRGVFVRGEGDLLEAFAPPYGPTAQAIVDAAFAGVPGS